ncbi:EF-hand domain-containing protein [uncultured Gimesia sp.]|uniref:EF-hand domain-containing protein n=1 Tax=uncultured Gimesia sp. TaxID=1678688 RepID=UPI00260B1CEE|nr:EF-hand domain-containing protein [uncultured Gimesia sp.]
MKVSLLLVSTFVFGITVFAGNSVMQAEQGKKGERPNREQILKKFDKDGDGKLSEAERSAAREARSKGKGTQGPGGKGKGKQGKGGKGFNWEEMLKKFDKNGDGKLDETERKAAFAARGKSGQKGPRMSKEEMIKKFDKDGDGKLGETERAAARKSLGARSGRTRMSREQMLKKFDKDGDGKLSEVERKAAKAEMMKNRTQKGAGKGPKGSGQKGDKGKGKKA